MCMVCVRVLVFVCVHSHSAYVPSCPLSFGFVLFNALTHLIEGIMVVRREATLTFEPNALSHCPSAIPENHRERKMLSPLSEGFLRAWANHRKVSFSSIVMSDISRTKFLSNDMLKIKHLPSKIVLFSSTRTIMQ